MMKNKIKIQFQHFEGCPNSPKLLNTLKEALLEFDESYYTFEEVLIEDNADAQKYKFLGSPTIILNNKDMMGLPLPEISTLACRFYAGGLPSKDKIIEKIKLALLEN
jgi:protein-disulfide isomerase